MSDTPRPLGFIDTSETPRSGLEVLRSIAAGDLPFAPIGDLMDFTLVEADEGRVVITARPSEKVYNPLGMVHGGWALTLIDSACGCAGNTLLPAGVGYTTLETKTNFVRAITVETGEVRVTGVVVSPGRRVITAEARIEDAKGALLAHGTSTLFVLRP